MEFSASCEMLLIVNRCKYHHMLYLEYQVTGLSKYRITEGADIEIVLEYMWFLSK